MTDKIKKIENNEVDIIVATQMISKGFNFPSLNCIVVVNADNVFLEVILGVQRKTINFYINYLDVQEGLMIIQFLFYKHMKKIIN